MEAMARMSDPVHRLPGFAETLSKKLDNLTSEHAFVNQFHPRRSVVLPQERQGQFRLNEAKGACSSALWAVPSPSLQEIGTSLTVSYHFLKCSKPITIYFSLSC
ncbi:hypothetical protein MKW98_019879 [Papaver atlanticum]|uniref:Uncharacterized protein n=1 Tax=Papaver atlanticum TaxID=357466 RepID=A0AAD4X5Y5_9MAGN|nr:hypothetical protein MKW98_019879 [Papaver atlanticum]